MTVAQLIALLQACPPEANVIVNDLENERSYLYPYNVAPQCVEVVIFAQAPRDES